MTERNFYAVRGITIYEFASRSARDAWVKDHADNAYAISRRKARQIFEKALKQRGP